MTLAEIKNLDVDFLSVKQVAECLRMDQQTIRDQCERDIKWLGFPACRCGKSFRFPREGFIAWATGLTPMLVYRGPNTLEKIQGRISGESENDYGYREERTHQD